MNLLNKLPLASEQDFLADARLNDFYSSGSLKTAGSYQNNHIHLSEIITIQEANHRIERHEYNVSFDVGEPVFTSFVTSVLLLGFAAYKFFKNKYKSRDDSNHPSAIQ